MKSINSFASALAAGVMLTAAATCTAHASLFGGHHHHHSDAASAAAPAPMMMMATPADKGFLSASAEGSLSEYQLAELAERNSSNPQVLDFARTMTIDHSALNADNGKVSAMKGVLAPTMINRDHMRTMRRLARLSGSDFDAAYIKDQATDHAMDVAAFSNEITAGKDTDIIGFAQRGLPVVQHHLAMLQQIAQGMGVTLDLPAGSMGGAPMSSMPMNNSAPMSTMPMNSGTPMTSPSTDATAPATPAPSMDTTAPATTAPSTDTTAPAAPAATPAQ